MQTVIDRNAENPPVAGIGSIAKLSSFSTISEMTQKLVSFHTPSQINWTAKFGITGEQLIPAKASHGFNEKREEFKYYCAKCKTDIPDNVAKFCWNNRGKFGGRAYCRSCQKSI